MDTGAAAPKEVACFVFVQLPAVLSGFLSALQTLHAEFACDRDSLNVGTVKSINHWATTVLLYLKEKNKEESGLFK